MLIRTPAGSACIHTADALSMPASTPHLIAALRLVHIAVRQNPNRQPVAPPTRTASRVTLITASLCKYRALARQSSAWSQGHGSGPAKEASLARGQQSWKVGMLPFPPAVSASRCMSENTTRCFRQKTLQPTETSCCETSASRREVLGAMCPEACGATRKAGFRTGCSGEEATLM